MKYNSSFLGDTLEYGELGKEVTFIKQGINNLFAGFSLIEMKGKLNQTCTILCALGYESQLFKMIENGLLQYLNKRIRRLVDVHPPFYEFNMIGGLQESLNEWKKFSADLYDVILRVERVFFSVTRMVINSCESLLLRNVAFDFIKDLLRSKNDIRTFAQQCIQITVMWGFQRYWYHLSLNELPKLALVLEFMRELKIYAWIIEPCILKFCTTFYQDVVQNWMQSHPERSPLEYMDQLQKWTLRETQAFIACLSEETYNKWREIRRKVTFKNKLDYLFLTEEALNKNIHKDECISCFLIFNHSSFLQKLYLECDETKTLECFYQYYQECVEKQVEQILNLPFSLTTKPFHHHFYLPLFNCSYYPVFLYFLGYLIDFQKNLQWGIANLLQDNSHILQLTYLAWSKAFNKNKQIQVKVSRYIAYLKGFITTSLCESFLQHILKSFFSCHIFSMFVWISADYVHFLLTQKSMTTDMVLKELKNGMDVLSYLQSPSLFQVYYTSDFRKRVLLDCRYVLALEKEMVSFLSQVEYNDTFSKKIQDLLNTIEESFQITKTFRSYCKSLRKTHLVPFKFHLSLLPLSLYCDVWGHDNLLHEKKTPVIYDSPFFLLQNTFKTFYEKQFKGRKLSWNTQYGTCDVVVSVWNQNQCIQYNCQMTEIQALCLLLFNNKTSYELNEIVFLTGCEGNVISQHLESVCHPERRLLWKKNSNSTIYTWNEKFCTREPYASFLSDSFYTKNLQVNANSFESSIKEDSSYYIDALIMRIMKDQKQLSHSYLLKCLKEKLQRDISEAFLEERVQVLVEQAFLVESVEKPSFYTYCTNDF